MNVNLIITKVSKHKSKIDFEEWEDDTDEAQNTTLIRYDGGSYDNPDTGGDNLRQ